MNQIIYFRYFVVMAFLSALHTSSEARPIKPIPDELLIRAKREMNYKGEIKRPPIIRVSSSTLNDDVPNSNGLITMGMYHKKKIYIDKKLKTRDLIHRSIIYHELVHHVQNERYGPTRDCRLWMRKEREAYRLQEKYLIEKGIKGVIDFKTILRNIECPSNAQV